MDILKKLWTEEEAQDIAEYAVMLAVILVLVVGTIRLIGSNSNNVFSSVSSSLQQTVCALYSPAPVSFTPTHPRCGGKVFKSSRRRCEA
jgi:Flp pilus assembly pilin Flp